MPTDSMDATLTWSAVDMNTGIIIDVMPEIKPITTVVPVYIEPQKD